MSARVWIILGACDARPLRFGRTIPTPPMLRNKAMMDALYGISPGSVPRLRLLAAIRLAHDREQRRSAIRLDSFGTRSGTGEGGVRRDRAHVGTIVTSASRSWHRDSVSLGNRALPTEPLAVALRRPARQRHRDAGGHSQHHPREWACHLRPAFQTYVQPGLKHDAGVLRASVYLSTGRVPMAIGSSPPAIILR